MFPVITLDLGDILLKSHVHWCLTIGLKKAVFEMDIL